LIAVEAKGGRRFKPAMTKGLQAITALSGVERRILVYGGKDSWRTNDGVEVISAARFNDELAKGL
jgi:hypothetical protein